MNTVTLIEVSGNELQFIRQHAPKAFTGTVAEALITEGYQVGRVKVHQELHTIKDGYDSVIINKTRELLKAIKNVEFDAQKFLDSISK